MEKINEYGNQIASTLVALFTMSFTNALIILKEIETADPFRANVNGLHNFVFVMKLIVWVAYRVEHEGLDPNRAREIIESAGRNFLKKHENGTYSSIFISDLVWEAKHSPMEAPRVLVFTAERCYSRVLKAVRESNK